MSIFESISKLFGGRGKDAPHPLVTEFLAKAASHPIVTWPRAKPPCELEFDQLDDASLRVVLLQCMQASQVLELRGIKRALASHAPEPSQNQYCAINDLIAIRLNSVKSWTMSDLDAIVEWSLSIKINWYSKESVPEVTKVASRFQPSELSPSVCKYLQIQIKNQLGAHKPNHAFIKKARAILGESVQLDLDVGEAWSDAAIADIKAMPAEVQTAWANLLSHCCAATSSVPSAKWLKEAAIFIDVITPQVFCQCIMRWFPLVDHPRTQEKVRSNRWEPDYTYLIIERHVVTLRGLCWLAGTFPDDDVARVVGKLGLSAYKKLPQIGPRAVKLGNAAVYTLGQMPGLHALGQLSLLKAKVKFLPAQKGIEKALTAAATRENLPRDEIDELAVPSYGLTDVGMYEEPMGDFTARLTVSGVGDTELVFIKSDNKIVKSVPAAVKESHADELRQLKLAMKDISAMLPAQKDRIDGLFLEQKTWAFPTWLERYLDHPLIGILARRLIWQISERENVPGKPVTWLDGKLVNFAGEPQSFNEDSAIVRLWHPLDAAQEEVLAWRTFFETRGVQQPFKQAHREIYLLTDAERNTGTYSNRYAAHVVRQHQFHALCAARGWRNKLRIMADVEYEPPYRKLEKWGLRAGYWVEGAGSEYGQDTNESGAFLHLITDQVRFYSINAAQASAHSSGGGYATYRGPETPLRPVPNDPNEPIALDQIPPLVFSEIMRDVDLFVGVASVGNNPNWQDGGPGNTYRDYWWSYSFGDLSGSAQSRRDLLQRLIPRLKIAKVCEMTDKYLKVNGKLRTYKIHFGSGNILMEPNDQYLCIVPNAREEIGSDIHLPFDGDRTLSIILSKAFMLAEDDKIKDPSILSQINRAR